MRTKNSGSFRSALQAFFGGLVMLLFCQMAQAQVFPDFTKMNFGCDGQRYLRDGLHPAEKGQQLMGRYIAKEIRNNYF